MREKKIYFVLVFVMFVVFLIGVSSSFSSISDETNFPHHPTTQLASPFVVEGLQYSNELARPPPNATMLLRASSIASSPIGDTVSEKNFKKLDETKKLQGAKIDLSWQNEPASYPPPSPAHPPNESFDKLKNYKKIAPALAEKLQKENKAKVIIIFKNETALENFSIRKNGKFKTTAKKEQKILGAHNALATELSEEEIENLANSNEIEKIEYDFPMHAFLGDSTQVINATFVWQKVVVGFNLTGANQTICIIDTGANYTHPNLGGCFGNNNASSNCKVLGGYDFSNGDSDPMDDNGHGTHVAGIVGANGSLAGVAPNARLIIIKSLDSSGSGTTSDIAAGIDWCVGNSSAFNIGVISMSLGTTSLYTSYCDGSFSTLASSINSAIAKNISVVVASGNSGAGIPRNTTAIASPACIQNSTSVSATDKDDAIASYAHYSSFTDLFAPGTSINSTNKAGGYLIDSGTSMAAPHAAGAIALLKQYLSLTNQTKTSLEIKNALKNHGRNISVPAGFNITRLNVYSALVSLDLDNPSVILSSPQDGSSSINANQTFICNASDLSLKNGTFFLWNSSSVLINQTEFTASAQNFSAAINISSLTAGNYNWNCRFYDENNNFALASSNFTISIATIAATLSSPANNLRTNQNQTFVCNASSTLFLTNTTFFLWNSSASLLGNEAKNLTGLANSSSFSFNFTYADTYYWNCLFAINNSFSAFALSNFSVVYDLTAPSLTVNSPQNNSWYGEGDFNVTMNEEGNCIYSLNGGGANYTMNTTNNLSFYSTNNSLLQDRMYNVTFYCNDSASNANSSLVFFNIDRTAPNITLISPLNNYEATGTTIVDFSFNVSDNLNITQCSLILNSASVAQNSSRVLQNATNTISYSLSPDSYTWRINCTDQATNIGNSTQRTLTINQQQALSVSNTGGGGSSPSNSEVEQKESTFVITKEEISFGSTKEIGKSDVIKFSITAGNITSNHSLKIENVTDNSVNMTINSEPVNLVLLAGQSIKLNITSPYFYDLFLKLNSITNKKANLTIQNIEEEIGNSSAGGRAEGNRTTITDDFTQGGQTEKSIGRFYSYLLIIFIVLLAVIYLIVRSRRGKLKSKPKKRKSLVF